MPPYLIKRAAAAATADVADASSGKEIRNQIPNHAAPPKPKQSLLAAATTTNNNTTHKFCLNFPVLPLLRLNLYYLCSASHLQTRPPGTWFDSCYLFRLISRMFIGARHHIHIPNGIQVDYRLSTLKIFIIVMMMVSRNWQRVVFMPRFLKNLINSFYI